MRRKPKKCSYCGKQVLFIPFGSPKLPKMNFCSAECENQMLKTMEFDF